MQLDVARDRLTKIAEARRLMQTLNLYTGLRADDIKKDIQQKISVLRWLVAENITDVHQIGIIMSKYYLGKLHI